MKEQRLGTWRWQILFLWWQVGVLLPAGPCSSQKLAPVSGEVREEGEPEEPSGEGGPGPFHAMQMSSNCSGSLNTVHYGEVPDSSWHGGGGDHFCFPDHTGGSCFCLQTPEGALVQGVHFPLSRKRAKEVGRLWLLSVPEMHSAVWQTCQRKWEEISDWAPIRSATLGKVLSQRYFTEIRRNLGIDFWQAIPEQIRSELEMDFMGR